MGELIKDSAVQAMQAQSGMKFGKMSTFFLRLAGKGRVKTPRFATERAIFRLKVRGVLACSHLLAPADVRRRCRGRWWRPQSSGVCCPTHSDAGRRGSRGSQALRWYW